jgi:hypothetical protein
MNKTSNDDPKTPSQMIDKRIDELADGRGKSRG